MLRVLILVIILLTAISVFAGDTSTDREFYYNPYTSFKEATSCYAQSQFKDAVKLYEGILKHGYESAPLYYNLGNTYLKLRLLGSAILNYERAKRIMPYDSDLKSNLNYANSLTQQPAMEGSRLWLGKKIETFLGAFTINGLTLMLIATYLMAILLACLALFNKPIRKFVFKFVVVLGLIFMLVLTLLTVKIYRIEHVRSAIMLQKETDAKFEPLTATAVHFRLYAGSKIKVLRIRGQWSQIKREDGKIGWIESDTYGII